ncbi:hypothetical protein [Winogradskyella sp. J14-2]|uniref:hypothetical protein n=1 Tax=Winogradskyella sp. J14-2 TaxID=1936080 RepID=UPI0012FCA082|nr:hypothetical protein [Winogradskyella sp. J14-2]
MSSKIKERLIIGGIFTTLFVGGFLHNKTHFDELSEFGEITEATIISFRYRSDARYNLTFEYYVDGKRYISSEAVSFFRCNETDNDNKGCIGKIFKLTYSNKDPNVCEIDLGKYNWTKGYKPH